MIENRKIITIQCEKYEDRNADWIFQKKNQCGGSSCTRDELGNVSWKNFDKI